jgi:tRNA-2-methylthio-N6-dimethylallyladenosine synthase
MSSFQTDLQPLQPEDREPRKGHAVYIETYGCQMNVYDSQAIGSILARAGYETTTAELDADIVLLNTCSVRDLAEHKIHSRVGELRRRRRDEDLPQPVIGICGCMAERMGGDLRKGPNPLDLVVGVDNYDQLPGMLDRLMAGQQKGHRIATGHRTDAHYVAPPDLYPTNNSHLVTIHKGCDYKCTYCIVPYTRGPQSEKSPEAIVAEIEQIVAAGGREVTLLGQNVTAYNWNQDLDFAALLDMVAAIDGLDRIRFLTGHPRDMHRHLMDAIGRLEKVCPWLHIPMQSGSDRVLRRMKRLYTSGEYYAMVDYARQVIPEVTFSSDFIVGFPGETEDDFQATLEAVRRVKYDQIFSFKYSERPGVPAARLDDDVTVDAKKDRLARLIALQEEIWNDEAARQLGKVWTGIVESPARRPAGSWQMRTANNRKVVVAGEGMGIGQRLGARITGFQNTTYLGESIEPSS